MTADPATPPARRDTRPVAFGTRSRLHPTTLFFSFVDSVRAFIIPGLIVLLFAWGEKYDLFFMVLFLPAMITAILRYISLSYEITATEVVIRQGIISRTERHILIDRIHNLDTVQSPLMRAFGVAELTIETAGGAMEAEASLKVVSRAAVDQIRAHVKGVRDRSAAEGAAASPSTSDASRARPFAWTFPASTGFAEPVAGNGRVPPSGASRATETNAAPAAPAVEPILRLKAKHLVGYGLASGRGLAIVGAAMAIAWQFGAFDRIGDHIESLFPWLERVPLFWAVVAGIPLGALFLALLSIVWSFLKLFGFELRRTADGLHSVCGLLTRREATIPNGRIQSLSLRQNPLHRLSGSFTMRVETAGGDINSQDQLNRYWVVPIARLSQAPALTEAILPETGFHDLVWHKPHPRVRRRLFLRWLLLTIVVTTIVYLNGAGPWTALPLGLLPLGWIAACLRYRMLEYAFDGERLHVADGLIGRRHDIVPVGRIQAVGLHQTPIDRYHGLSTVNVATAGQFGGGARARVFGVRLRRGMALYHRLRNRTEQVDWATSAALDQTTSL